MYFRTDLFYNIKNNGDLRQEGVKGQKRNSRNRRNTDCHAAYDVLMASGDSSGCDCIYYVRNECGAGKCRA